MSDIVELSNYEIKEYCLLSKSNGDLTFYKDAKKSKCNTGLYFRDGNTFFALYSTVNGPTIYFEGKEYQINKNLTIKLEKDGKNRTFKIVEYGIEIHYIESPYIDFDSWSDEIHVDLFFMIVQRYKNDEWYIKKD